jgi:hypothetical protein
MKSKGGYAGMCREIILGVAHECCSAPRFKIEGRKWQKRTGRDVCGLQKWSPSERSKKSGRNVCRPVGSALLARLIVLLLLLAVALVLGQGGVHLLLLALLLVEDHRPRVIDLLLCLQQHGEVRQAGSATNDRQVTR